MSIRLKDVLHFYIGQKFIATDSLLEDKEFGIIGYIIDQWRDNWKLILRPLSSMTHEEALELCELIAPGIYGDYRYSKWEVTLDQKSDENWKAYDVSNEKVEESFVIDLIDGDIRIYDADGIAPYNFAHLHWQWYFKKGFDVFELIKSGQAVDATTLNKNQE